MRRLVEIGDHDMSTTNTHTHCPHCERQYGPRADDGYRQRHEAGCGSADMTVALVEALRVLGLAP